MTTHGGYPAPGEMIGSYRVEGRLGGGGMGVVFEARDAVLDRSVALKVISPHLADDPAFRARFTREAQAQASLDSPHVVHVYAHGEAAGRLYIATQLIPDGDLGRMVRAHGSPPLRTALDLVAQVAAGLADAHAAGLVHRDIKPANVLLRRRDEGFVAYLADFGIARQVGGDTASATTHTVGTPTYMAPELHTGGTPGVASDVYSLGCLLWATVSGTAPYGGTSDYEIVSAHLEQPVPQLDGGGPLVTAVNRILRTAMAKQPGDRYASAAAMRDELRAAAGLPDDPAGAPVAGATSPRSRILRVVGLVALLVALGVGAAVAVASGDEEPDAQVTDPDPPTTSATFATLTPDLRPSTPASGSDEEERAIDSFASALDDQGLMSGTQSQCVARTVVQDVGLSTLVEKGFFDEDQEFLDPDLATMPEVKSALTSATLTCLT